MSFGRTIAEPCWAGTDDDVLEFLGFREQALCGHDEGLVDTAAHRRRADLADAEGLVLALDGIAHLLRRHPSWAMRSGRSQTRMAMSGRPKTLARLAPGTRFSSSGCRGWRSCQEGCVVAVVLREDRDHEQEAGGLAVDGHPCCVTTCGSCGSAWLTRFCAIDLVDVRVASRLQKKMLIVRLPEDELADWKESRLSTPLI